MACKILGLQCNIDDDFHDSSAALICNDNLYSIEEERFTRVKHSPGVFPVNSVKSLLSRHNIKFEDIDIIAIPKTSSLDSFIQMISDQLEIRKDEVRSKKFIQCDHHLSHFCNSYFMSGFNDASGLVVDADGDDDTSTSMFIASGNHISKIRSFDSQVSLGQMYLHASEFCGFGQFGEGKMMGLASFGTDTGRHFLDWNSSDELCSMSSQKMLSIQHKDDSQYAAISMLMRSMKKNDQAFKQYLESMYPYQKCVDQKDIIYYKDIAATMQSCYENIVLKMVQWLRRNSESQNLILSGGCIQNCTANDKIVRSGLFKHTYCSSIPHDGGIAAGNALYAASLNDCIPVVCQCVFDDNVYDVQSIPDPIRSKVSISKTTYKQIAHDLRLGRIIGWFQSGSELGPRALGHRSILADPTIRDNLHILNDQIKNREMFRPLAPVVMKQHFSEVFDTDNYDLCQFMLRTVRIRDSWQSKIPAVCHIDKTSRPQVLDCNDNPQLYSLIDEFYKISDVPCLISTSFNRKNEPIVETIDDAIRMLLDKYQLDYIVVNGEDKISRRT